MKIVILLMSLLLLCQDSFRKQVLEHDRTRVFNQQLHSESTPVNPYTELGSSETAYRGGISRRGGLTISWRVDGPSPTDVIKATIDNLSHQQRTNMASEKNAKLLFALIRAVEEFEGTSPDTNLIPKGEQ